MRNLENSDRLTCYIVHNQKGFLTSYKERENSSLYARGSTYYEILVFEWDFKTREQGGLIYQDGGSFQSFLKICENLFNKGVIE